MGKPLGECAPIASHYTVASRKSVLGGVMLAKSVNSLKEMLPLAALFVELVLAVGAMGLVYYGFVILLPQI
jgi:hypothetical protein